MSRCRRAVAVLAGLCAWTGLTGAATADEGGGARFRSDVRSEAGSATATLTDCPTSGPVGFECTGWVVTAGYNQASPGPATTFLSVQMFDVVLTGGGTFTATPAGSGFAQDADVQIDRELDSATATGAVDVQLCSQEGCAFVRTVAVDVDWQGTGEVTTSRFRDHQKIDGCTFRFNSRTEQRAAVVVDATVDGVPTPNSVRPEFAPSLSTSEDRARIVCK